MIALISTLIFGLIIGMVAKLLMPGDDPGGIFVTSLIGVAGAFIGGLIYNLVHGGGDLTRWTWGGLFFGILGSIILLALYRMVTQRRRIVH